MANNTKSAMTIKELLVTLVVIGIIIAIVLPTIAHLRHSSQTSGCEANLKSLATAISNYSQDFGGNYPRAGAKNSFWAKRIGWDYEDKLPIYKTPEYEGQPIAATVTASWFLLVKYEDLFPTDFICPASETDEGFTYTSHYRHYRQLWDFGDNPYMHVSYSMHLPFSKFPASSDSPSDFVIAADKSPWFDGNGDIKDFAPENSTNHNGTGQTVLFNDASIKFTSSSSVGIDDDPIYTYSPDDIAPTARDSENDAISSDDSFLVL